MATPPMVPAGWYPDPAGRHEYRYWDGTYWTAGVADGGVTAHDPLEGPPPPVQQAATPPAQQTATPPAQQAATPQFPGGFTPVPPLPGATAQAPPFPGAFGPVTGAPAPATGQRRPRRWGLIAAIAGAVVVILIIGLVIWAPWNAPPLLRPTGLSAGTLTTDSVAFHWSNPPTGPLPDKYLILHDGKVIASVPGTATSYQVTGLAPDTPYEYRIVAERGGERSAMSTLLAVRTTIPPISAARWQGTWTVNAKFTRGSNTIHGAKRFTDTWLANPRCATGPCDVRLAVTLNGHSFKLAMARSGAGYRGTIQRNVFPCGSGSTQFPVRSTLAFRITLTTAQVTNGAWLASGWAGSINVTSPYTASGNLYCPTAHQVLAISGSP